MHKLTKLCCNYPGRSRVVQLVKIYMKISILYFTHRKLEATVQFVSSIRRNGALLTFSVFVRELKLVLKEICLWEECVNFSCREAAGMGTAADLSTREMLTAVPVCIVIPIHLVISPSPSHPILCSILVLTAIALASSCHAAPPSILILRDGYIITRSCMNKSKLFITLL